MMLKNLKGRVAFIFDEEDFDVDQIVGVKNIKLRDIDEMAAVAMQSYDPDFAKNVQAGDLLVGNVNFGYGHPHYPPLKAMRHLGIAGIVAESFSPGYWRGEVANGFPQVACPGIMEFVDRWDQIEVDWQGGVVRNLTKGAERPFDPLSKGDLDMISAGGLEGFIKNKIQQEKKAQS
ncbi:MAG: 3-isopropylmalate dehydratase [Alphaproteobacteria bacterium]|nr:3-isopropylmalate dehydratase [Alphaproteobacteria bacterium]MBT4085534.1 3-isopropylmalate dehydratase [Alphaproteobacteria bacterium]MBT4544303.1 3-isopropylmalate dehydratase [Alphaproteobacteria bacterium]